MSTEAALEIVKLLAPAGSLAVVAGILAYRSPQLLKELFSGIGSLVLTIDKVRRVRPPHKRVGFERKTSAMRATDGQDERNKRAA